LVQGLGLEADFGPGRTADLDADVELGWDFALPTFDFVAVGLVFRPIMLL
jgi:hypothetical protein